MSGPPVPPLDPFMQMILHFMFIASEFINFFKSLGKMEPFKGTLRNSDNQGFLGQFWERGPRDFQIEKISVVNP